MTYMRAGVPALFLLVAVAGCGRVEGLSVDIVDSGGTDDGAAPLGDDATMNVRGPTRKGDAAADEPAVEVGEDRGCPTGSCTPACTPGQKMCNGNIPQTCTPDGQWRSDSACPFVCAQGACAGVCLPGARQCDANGVPQTCDASGAWQNNTPCPFVCSQGLCTGLCKPGTQSCNGTVPQTCSAAGEWQLGNPCPFVCSNGQCAGMCTPGARQCSNNIPQTCGAGGQWQNGTPCPFVCVAATAACGGQCVPNARQCTNGMLQTCDATGTWQTTGTATQTLLANGGFDAGPGGGWNETTVLGTIVTLDDGTLETTAQTPSYLAWIGGYDDADDELSQTVTVPASASGGTLSFYYKVLTEESRMGSEFDTLDVYLVAADGTMMRLAHFSDNSATAAANPPWTRFSTTLPPGIAGRTFDLVFIALTDSTLITSFYIDTVSLDVAACP